MKIDKMSFACLLLDSLYIMYTLVYSCSVYDETEHYSKHPKDYQKNIRSKVFVIDMNVNIFINRNTLQAL